MSEQTVPPCPRFAAPALAAVVLLWIAAGASAQVKFLPPRNLPDTMKKLEGRYHTLYHDLTVEESYEAMLRMEAMTEEYLERTRGFSGRLQGKMPFVLFRNAEDYYAAGGMRGSAGVFTGTCLMAIAGEKLTPETWHVIQHEGFHEFAAAVINPNMPIWINEGLAEYFGEAVFTGDGFVSGAIPQFRMKRIQQAIEGKQFRTVEEMMRLSHAAWNSQLNIANYDQAWAMTMFLAHGDDGKYQKTFGAFMDRIARGWTSDRAWTDTFGSAAGFDTKFQAWWLVQTDEAPVPVYARATAQMLASYLARATSQRQAFGSVDELVTAIKEGKVRWHKDDVLPPGLAGECDDLYNAIVKAGGKFEIQSTGTGVTAKPQAVICELRDGTKITATFRVSGSRVKGVDSKVEKPKLPPTPKNAPARK